MKIIALIPAKNEEVMLSINLPQIKRFVDQIIVMDDGSTDNTIEVAKNYGAHIIKNEKLNEVWWSEEHIRNKMLEYGRGLGGTHFLCLDADEYPSETFIKNKKKLIEKLKPGEKLFLRWVSLWKSTKVYRDDNGPFGNLFKDFLVFDDGKINHSSVRDFYVGRTPGNGRTVKVPVEQGCILHLQFIAWKRFQIKQASYLCSELVKYPGEHKRINYNYSLTKDDEAKTKPVPEEWIHEPIPESLADMDAGWYLDKIHGFFDKHGISYFEPLEIWHIPELKEKFVEKMNREPITKAYTKKEIFFRKTGIKIFNMLPGFIKRLIVQSK